MSGRRTQRGPGVVSALRRLEDPAESADPRIRSLVASLSELDYAPAPEPDFRAELRAQLVAVAPRIVAESRETAEAATSDAREGTQAPVADLERRRRRFAHPLGIAAGVAAAFVMLFGGALWLSQKSLPGDSLYGLKRAGENIRLDLASSGTDRGHLYLSLAQTRVEEARALVQHSEALAGGGTLAGGRLSPGTASLVSSTLNSADADLADGSTELNRQAVTSHSDSPARDHEELGAGAADPTARPARGPARRPAPEPHRIVVAAHLVRAGPGPHARPQDRLQLPAARGVGQARPRAVHLVHRAVRAVAEDRHQRRPDPRRPDAGAQHGRHVGQRIDRRPARGDDARPTGHDPDGTGRVEPGRRSPEAADPAAHQAPADHQQLRDLRRPGPARGRRRIVPDDTLTSRTAPSGSQRPSLG